MFVRPLFGMMIDAMLMEHVIEGYELYDFNDDGPRGSGKVHESIFRSFKLLEWLEGLLERGVPGKVAFDLLAELKTVHRKYQGLKDQMEKAISEAGGTVTQCVQCKRYTCCMGVNMCNSRCN